MMKKIVLASTSPRRKEILSQTGLPFEVVDSKYQEDLFLSPNPAELTKILAFGKARAAARLFSDAIIISADQVISVNSQILGKPHSIERQRRMIQTLSGKKHEVITTVVVLDSKDGKSSYETEKSIVRFKNLSKDEINAYIATKEGLDRAGGYAIQGLGASLVESIEGDYLNIIGLPLHKVVALLKQFGINATLP